LGDRGQGHLLVIVIEDLKGVVPSVAQVVQALDHIGQCLAVHALSGKDPEVSGRRDALLDRTNLLPHEIGQLNQKDFLRIDQLQIVQRGVGGLHVKRIQADPQVGKIGHLHDLPSLVVLVDVSPPRQALIGHLNSQRQRQHGQLSQISGQVGLVV